MEQILLKIMLGHLENNEVIHDNQHGYSRSKLCLTNAVAFYDRVTVLVEKGSANDIIHLNLCKAFDTISHDIIVSKLEKHGFDGLSI